MKFHTRCPILPALAIVILLQALPALADPGQLTIDFAHPGPPICPMLYGLMTEEINHSYDGGVYGELIQNRAFQDNPAVPAHWSLVQDGGGAGVIALEHDQPVNPSLPTSLKLTVTTASAAARVGIANEGYWGIPVRPKTTYRLSFFARAADGFAGPIKAALESTDGATTYASGQVPTITAAWAPYTLTLKTGDTPPTSTARFVLSASSPGSVWFSLVSLFPPTFHDRPNGNRIDLMQKLGAMKPAFLRLPGGNYLEGNRIPERFEWKDTIGDIAHRPGHRGPWGYRSTDGMGLLEFLEWCEDLKMEPILAVYAGYSLGGEHVEPGPALTPFVDDALDEIEYVTGGAATRWGARRIADGHPAPFPLQYVEIGNEDAFDRSRSYDGRFAQFFDAIKARYPKLQIIATTGVRSRVPDVRDDHYYRSAAAMERDVHHYDNTSRTGPKIFVGEWASTEGSPTPTMQAALGDAAWLTGLERNSDIVQISCYAPLLVNVNRGARQWGTNLVGYDALTSFGSPSYYVQAMFGNNRGDVVLPVQIVPQNTPAPATVSHGGVGVGTWNTQAEFKEMNVTRGSASLFSKNFTNDSAGLKMVRGNWQVQDGVLRQSGGQMPARTTAGDPTWTDYTFSIKARKTAGAEGFLILFHVQDADNYVWWNVGGWGNTRTGLERFDNGVQTPFGPTSPVTVETGRWYDIRVEVQGRMIRCYLDDKLITTATDEEVRAAASLFATASRDNTARDVILKVVNVSPAAQQVQVNLNGVTDVAGEAASEVVQGEPGDVNTITEPQKVMPRTIPITGVARTFLHEFPPHSVTVMRIKAH